MFGHLRTVPNVVISKPIQLLITTPNLDTAGMKYVIADLISGLNPSLIRPSLCVHRSTGTPLELKLRDQVENFMEIPLQISPRPFWNLWKDIRRVAENFRGRFDLVHSFDYSSNWTEGAAVRMAGIPWIAEKTNMTWGTRRWWLWAAMASRIVCLSETQQRNIFEKSFFRKKTQVIHTGIDLAQFQSHNDRRRIRESMGIPENAIAIACVAKMVRVKGHPELLEAFSKIVKANAGKNVFLVLIGGDQPDYEKELKTLAGKLSILEFVRFLGRRDDVPKLLPAFDGFIHATRNWGPKESFGAVLVEAMASGLPVIATRSGGPEDIVVYGETGWLVDAEGIEPLVSALQEFFRDRELRIKFGVAGRKRAEKIFSRDRMIRDYEALYLSTAKNLS